MHQSRKPTLMNVRVNDKIVERAISHYDGEARRFVPETMPHEEIIWHIGDITPTIIATREPDEEEDYEVCPICECAFFIRRCTRCGYEPA